MVRRTSKILLITLTSLALLTSVSAETNWEFDPLGEPLNQHDISVNSSTIFTTHLRVSDSGDKIRPSDIENFVEEGDDTEEAPYVIYEYEAVNLTTGDPITVNESMQYDHSLDLWYAEFETNNTDMEELRFKAEGAHNDDGLCCSGGQVEETLNIGVSEVRTDLLKDNLEIDIDQPIKAGEEDKFDIRTMNITSEEPIEDEMDVNLYFHDTEETVESYSVDNYNTDPIEDGGQYHFNSEVSIPSETDKTYGMRISSIIGGEESSQSFLIQTAPAIDGQVNEIVSSGCNFEATECEPDTDINTTFDITTAEAQGVNSTLYGFNQTTGEKEEISEVQMEEVTSEDGAEQSFEADTYLPDLNTSRYEKNLEMEFYAWNQDRDFTEIHEIDLTTFTIQDRSSPTAVQERTHEVEFLFAKPFTINSYDLDRFDELTLDIYGPEGYHQNHSREEFETRESDGIITTDIVISEESTPGAFDLEVSATDVYGEDKQFDTVLEVIGLEEVFRAEDNVQFDYNALGAYEGEFEVENFADTEKTILAETDTDEITIEDFTLEPSEATNISFGIDLMEPEDLQGEINLEDEDTTFNQTVNFEVNGPECSVNENELCLFPNPVEFNLHTDDSVTESLEIVNLNLEEEKTLETEFSGNISESVSTADNTTVESFSSLDLTFEPNTPGNYTGRLDLVGNETTTSVNLTAVADFEEQNLEITSEPSTIQLGSIPEGESVSEVVTINNTGDVAVDSISADSDDFEIDIAEFSLEPDQHEEVDLTLSEPNSGTIAFTGNVSDQEISTIVEVQADIIEDYSDRTSELSTKVNELRSDVDDPDLNNELTEVSGMVDRINAKWDSGEYEEAKGMFESAEATLNSVEQQANQEPSPGQGQDNNGETGAESESQGGVPIIPILAVMFIMFLMSGFVFYESYIPEEGDPLYGVLGPE